MLYVFTVVAVITFAGGLVAYFVITHFAYRPWVYVGAAYLVGALATTSTLFAFVASITYFWVTPFLLSLAPACVVLLVFWPRRRAWEAGLAKAAARKASTVARTSAST